MARALVAGALVILTGCGLPAGDYFGEPPEVEDPRYFRWCNSAEPEGLDPGVVSSTTATKLLHALFDGLTESDNSWLAAPTPSLATHWEISPDLRRFTFHLRNTARWSNGRELTAYDVAYHVARVLHPLTASVNGGDLDFIKNGGAYTANLVRLVLRDTGGLKRGDIVEIVAAGGRTVEEMTAKNQPVPDSNARTASRPLRLRDLGAGEDAAYEVVPPRTVVTLVELSGGPASPPTPPGAMPWAYVHWNTGDGVYGWVPAAELDGQPNGDVVYRVRPVPKKKIPGLDASLDELAADLRLERPILEVAGKDLLMLPDVLGIRAPDPLTFVVETADPTPFLIDFTLNRHFRPTPREAVSRWPRRWTDPGRIVTSGGLHLVEWEERDHLELLRSPTFWNRDAVKLDRLTVFSMDDQAANANYYYHGDCDASTQGNTPASYLPVLSGKNRGGRPYKDYYNVPFLGVYYVVINTKRVSNVHLRRALAYAVDRRVIPKFINGDQTPTARFIPGQTIHELTDEQLAVCGVHRDTPGLALMVDAGLCYMPPPGLDFDPDRARAELAQARAELGASFPARIAYKYNTGVESHKLVAEYLQVQWRAILGLDIEVETQEWKVYLSDTRSGNYDMGRLGWIGEQTNPESDFMPLWRCKAPNNRAKWCDPSYDRLLDEARTIIDRRKRLEKIYEAEKLMIEQAPIIPLYVYTQQHLVKPYVRGLELNFVDRQVLWRAWRDPDWRMTAENH